MLNSAYISFSNSKKYVAEHDNVVDVSNSVLDFWHMDEVDDTEEVLVYESVAQAIDSNKEWHGPVFYILPMGEKGSTGSSEQKDDDQVVNLCSRGK